MKLARSATAFAALLLIWSGSAMAARNAYVVGGSGEPGAGSGAVLRSAPFAGSQPLATLSIGSPITISNYPTKGYYKARTSSGQLGWIAITSVGSAPPASPALPTAPAPAPAVASPTETPPPRPQQTAEPPAQPEPQPMESQPEGAPPETETIPYQDVQPTESAEEQPSQPAPSGPRLPFEIKVFAGSQSLQSVTTFSTIGVSLYSSMPYHGVQFGLPVSDRIFLLLRLEHLANSSSQANYAFSLSSTPVMAGLSYSFLQPGAPGSLKVRLRGSLLMGVALATTLDATATSEPAPNVSELETQAFTEMLKADFEVPVSRKFALYTEAGYRFLNSSSIGPSPVVNGSSIFEQGGNNVPIPLNLSGFFFGGGLAVYL